MSQDSPPSSVPTVEQSERTLRALEVQARLYSLHLFEALTARERRRAETWRAVRDVVRGWWGGPIVLTIVGVIGVVVGLPVLSWAGVEASTLSSVLDAAVELRTGCQCVDPVEQDGGGVMP